MSSEIRGETTTELHETEMYVDYKPVLLNKPRGSQSLWPGFVLALQRVGPYCAAAIVIGLLLKVGAVWIVRRVSFDAEVWNYLATVFFVTALFLFIYEFINQRKAATGLWERLGSTTKRAGYYCGIGFALGCLTLLILDAIQVDEEIEKLLAHLADAFFVSAIVIFGYEWGSEAKRALDLAASLVYLLDTYARKILKASARTALVNSVQELAGDQAAALSDQLQKFADALDQLDRGDWAAPGYLAFIRHYHDTLANNVDRLAQFSRRIRREPGSTGVDFHIDIPDAASVADTMVEGMMDRLARRGGDYYAVSDAVTWERLKGFKAVQKTAWSQNVSIRRIFVIGKRSDSALPVERVASIVTEQYEDAQKSGGKYEIRITDTDEFAQYPMSDLGKSEHFGIFAPRGDTAIVVRVDDEFISKFTLQAATPLMISDFTQAWNALDEINGSSRTDLAETVIRDHLFAYCVRRIASGNYIGVSSVLTWRAGAFSKFLRISDVRRDVTFRRILVFDEESLAPAARPAVIEVLRRHRRAERNSSERYRWRICMSAEWDNMQIRVPFGVFTGTFPEDPTKTVTELALGKIPYLAVPEDHEDEKLKESFDQVWMSVGTFEESFKKVFGNDAETILRSLETP